MKHICVSVILGSLLLMQSGCKKFLDINTDPNNPLAVKEAHLLAPVEITLATQVVGGTTSTVNSYWMQQLSMNQPSPSLESYLITPTDADNTWNYYLYANIFSNLDIMLKQAAAAKRPQYQAVGKTLFAYSLAITTDLWNHAIYSEGFRMPDVMQPRYDKQEALYTTIQGMLDSALYFCDQPLAQVAPGAEDYIYKGKMTQWKKFIYTLKARYYLRLSKAPGHTAAVQAEKALEALEKGFKSNDDNARIVYAGTAQAENPWSITTRDATGGVVMAQSFIDSLVTRHDPRLSVLTIPGKDGVYRGRRVGDLPAPDPKIYSRVNTFYAGAGAALHLATYAEALFIKAEATLIKQGATAAQPVYEAAIAAHMTMLGIPAAAQQTYIASRPVLTTANALQQIITEKYVAGFLSPEPYNDWRRTGFPVLKAHTSGTVKGIPRRWPYPANEMLTNPQPEQQVTINDRVWWDKE
ncbi:SusD/RagB family nutrient-binding outer membrane lipoprotein [Chitinophaga nivalis]|uniref:SusD/RagB family nutrient-binding outer membrane lipoprotein n=1 Tax=Chitinophaga nivalis TaxID=2991709 RepID=A0ABT3II55_9BACT|nr:SusD/RagB family nutrient-binding outer membrane lipoprotein [Chitinophaga nivalis]MCW3466703.1 SusD/RagB family nutrient-binding outer membrane lipoprotein [Chitinophaga nivalis]MCW3483606.1 SusD/RagB family nutrient-binding outer membrane lipoprotein [Chitinophaga nivalis]